MAPWGCGKSWALVEFITFGLALDDVLARLLAEEVGVNGWTDLASLAMGLGITSDKQMASDVD